MRCTFNGFEARSFWSVKDYAARDVGHKHTVLVFVRTHSFGANSWRTIVAGLVSGPKINYA